MSSVFRFVYIYFRLQNYHKSPNHFILHSRNMFPLNPKYDVSTKRNDFTGMISI